MEMHFLSPSRVSKESALREFKSRFQNQLDTHFSIQSNWVSLLVMLYSRVLKFFNTNDHFEVFKRKLSKLKPTLVMHY